MAMWIIPSAANEDGGRSNMQTWNGATLPDGYYWCDEQYVDTYCQAKGFVNIEVNGDTVTSMTVNQEALDKWNTEHPDPEPVEPEPTTDDIVNALIGYDPKAGATTNEEEATE